MTKRRARRTFATPRVIKTLPVPEKTHWVHTAMIHAENATDIARKAKADAARVRAMLADVIYSLSEPT